MNREIIIDRIITLSKKLNKTPTKREYAKEYNNTEFSRYFKGAYTEALKEAGLKLNYNNNLTKEDVLKKYREYISIHGMNFSSRNVPKGLPGVDLISKKLWNGWNDFLDDLGQEKKVNLFHRFSKDEMIKFLQEKIDDGTIKTSSDIYNNRDLYSKKDVLDIVYNLYKKNDFRKLKWREILITKKISDTAIHKYLSNKIGEVYKIVLEEKSKRND